MRKIYSAEHAMMVDHIKSILQDEGMPCLIKNQNLSGAEGGIPATECWPEIWLLNDEDYNHAKKIVHSLISQSGKKSWKCNCGEEIEGQFSNCWHCGASSPML